MPLQNLMENLPSRDQAAGGLQELLSNPRVASMLLAGAGGGVVGGALSARSPRRRGETRGERRRRILRDALLTAGAGAGVVGLGQYGYDQLNTVLPEGPQNPISRTGSALKIPGMALGGAGLGHAFGTRPAQERAARDILAVPGIREALGNPELKKYRQFVDNARTATRHKDLRARLPEDAVRNVGGRGVQGFYDDVSQGAGKGFSWLTGGGPGSAVESAKSNLGGKREAIRGILGNKNIGRGAKATQLTSGGARVLDKTVRRGIQSAAKHPRTAGAALALTALPAAYEYGVKPLSRRFPSLTTFGDR